MQNNVLLLIGEVSRIVMSFILIYVGVKSFLVEVWRLVRLPSGQREREMLKGGAIFLVSVATVLYGREALTLLRLWLAN